MNKIHPGVNKECTCKCEGQTHQIPPWHWNRVKKLVVCVFLMGGRRIYCYFMSLKNIMFPDPHTVQRTSTVDTSDAIPEKKILLFTYSWAKIYLSLFNFQ